MSKLWRRMPKTEMSEFLASDVTTCSKPCLEREFGQRGKNWEGKWTSTRLNPRENEDGFTIQLWVRYRCSLLSRAGPAHSPNKAWRHDTGRPRPKPNTHFLLGTMKDQVVAVAPMPVRYRPIIILLLSADHTLLLARLITSYRKSGIQVDLIPGHMTYQHSAVTVTVQVVVLAWRQVKKERLWQRREHNDRKPPQRWPSSVLQVQHHSWISYAVASSLYIFALFQQYQTMHIYSYVRTS